MWPVNSFVLRERERAGGGGGGGAGGRGVEGGPIHDVRNRGAHINKNYE